MTCYTLGRRHIGTESEVTDKCANCHSEHDPAIVGHEQKPTTYQHHTSNARISWTHMMKKL